MPCPKCKNPNGPNRTVCQWCGARIAPEPHLTKLPKGDTLLDLVKKGDTFLAMQIYREQTGAGLEESKAYVDELLEKVEEKRDDKKTIIIAVCLIVACLLGLGAMYRLGWIE